jgi:hypothetical protein
MTPHKHLALLSAALVTSMVSGCASNTPASTPASSAQASAATAATQALPSNPKMGVNVGYAKDLRDYNNVVVVPSLYVKFLVDGKVFVSKQGSALSTLGGGSANSVKASAKYKVAGLDKAMAQGIAKQAYDDFVGKLRTAGYTVLTYNDIKDRDFVKGAAREKNDQAWGMPTENAVGSSDTFVIAAPSDEQSFKYSMAGGQFSEFIRFGKPRFTDATVIIPTYTIVAPQVWGGTSGGYSSISASINAADGMNLQYASALWMGKPKTRMGGGNAAGVVTKAQIDNVAEKVGTLSKEDTTPTAANALSKGLSMLAGTGSITGNSANYVLTINPAAYKAGALKAIGDFNTEVAKAAAGAN